MKKLLFVTTLFLVSNVYAAPVAGLGECCGSSAGGLACGPGLECTLEGGWGSDASCSTALVVGSGPKRTRATLQNASRHAYGYRLIKKAIK